MAFTQFERAANHAALKWFLARRRPPEHIHAELDIGYAVVGHTVDIFEIRPQWDDRNATRHSPVARAKFVRTRGLWRLYWRRADLKWHLYEPAPEHDALQDALAIVDADAFACFFG